jgi:hypothetical protein
LQKFSTVSYRAPLYFESYRTIPYRFLIFLYRTVPLPPQAHGIPYRKIPYRQKKFFFSPKFTIMGYVSYTDYFFWRIRRKKNVNYTVRKRISFWNTRIVYDSALSLSMSKVPTYISNIMC